MFSLADGQWNSTMANRTSSFWVQKPLGFMQQQLICSSSSIIMASKFHTETHKEHGNATVNPSCKQNKQTAKHSLRVLGNLGFWDSRAYSCSSSNNKFPKEKAHTTGHWYSCNRSKSNRHDSGKKNWKQARASTQQKRFIFMLITNSNNIIQTAW